MSIPCAYEQCYNIYRPGSPLSFFKLPKDVNRKTIWKKHCGRLDMSESARICDKHFYKTHFVIQPLKKTLTANALPKPYSKLICSCDKFQLDRKCKEILNQSDKVSKPIELENEKELGSGVGKGKRVSSSSKCTARLLQQNRNIQRNTLQTMIESNNSSLQLQDSPSIVSANSNFKLIFVNGLQQDMALCMACSKLEFISDGLQNHQCTSIQITDVSTLALSNSDVVLHNDMMHIANLNKIHPRNMAMIREQLAFSFAEMFQLEGFNDTGFKAMTRHLLNIGTTHGKINVKDLFGDQKTLEEERKSLAYMVKAFLKKVVAEEKLVFSCDMWKDQNKMKRCVTLSSHYIDDNFVLHRNVLGTRVYNENDFDGSKLVEYVTDILGEYSSTPSSILSNATIVTSKAEDFLTCFRNYGRLDCMCTILNEVVNHSLALPCFQTENVCKAIVIRLERQLPNDKYVHAVENYQLNDWLSIWYLFEAYENYLETTPTKNIIPDYEIIYTFVLEAQKASKLLSSSHEATISTVYLIKKKLIDVMRRYNTGSFKYPEYKDKVTSFAENNFEITDIHRITLFLDPRYKSLKFLSKPERDALHQTVRGIIGEIFIPDQSVKKLLNLGNHVSWVDTNGMAEVDNYLNLMNISQETNVLEFWKLRVDFPKLRTLAKEMLCIPAVSAAWECYFNQDKYNLSRRRLQLNLNELDTTLLLNGHSYYGMFDEQLKILFDS